MTQWGIDVLFNPGKRHMDEEKLRLQSTREEAGDSSDGQRIDLTSGKVVIQRAAKDQAAAELVTNESPETAGAEQSAAETDAEADAASASASASASATDGDDAAITAETPAEGGE